MILIIYSSKKIKNIIIDNDFDMINKCFNGYVVI